MKSKIFEKTVAYELGIVKVFIINGCLSVSFFNTFPTTTTKTATYYYH